MASIYSTQFDMRPANNAASCEKLANLILHLPYLGLSLSSLTIDGVTGAVTITVSGDIRDDHISYLGITKIA